MNQSLNGFLPAVYGFVPTTYALSVIEHKCITMNQSLNGFVPPIYDFCMCRVPYTMLCDKVQCYTTMIQCYMMNVNIAVPLPMTPMVADPLGPMALESLQLSESHGGPEFGLCNASTKLNLRDLILLDNQSTVDIFCNKRLLKDIHI